MPFTARMLYLHTLSPLHSGIGQGSGYIDLPIARDKTTNWPEIPGSGVKGALRSACRDAEIDESTITLMFGPDLGTTPNDAQESAGQLWISGARILCFPVRSLKGTFAWVTCPHAIRAWQRDYDTIGAGSNLQVPVLADDVQFLSTSRSKKRLQIGQKVLLEDLDLTVSDDKKSQVDAIADRITAAMFAGDTEWATYFTEHFGIVSDDVFTFLTTTCTPVTAHVRIRDDSKTVAKGALWYEETVPAETIFTLPITDRFGGLLDELAPAITAPIQVSGNASVGQGVIQARFDSKSLDGEV